MNESKKKSRNEINIEKLNKIKPCIFEDKFEVVKVQECDWNEFD